MIQVMKALVLLNAILEMEPDYTSRNRMFWNILLIHPRNPCALGETKHALKYLMEPQYHLLLPILQYHNEKYPIWL